MVAGGLAAIPVGPATAQQSDDASYYAPRDWQRADSGSIHFSVFAYRDMNGSGDFDIGDRAFSDIVVQAVTPGGKTLIDRSNIDGYANFNASLADEDRQFDTAGRYKIRLIPPPGWSVTSSNAEQTIEVTKLPGSPAGLVMTRMAGSIGLSPVLEIRGRVDAEMPGVPKRITAAGPDGATAAADVGESGGYALPVSAGAWSVAIGKGDTREIEIAAAPVILPRVAADRSPIEGDVVTVGFDDLLAMETAAKIPNGYKGLNWENMVVTNNHFYGGEGYINGTMDGDYVGYLGSGHPAVISRDKPFDFTGGYFSIAWSDAEGETLHLRAWRGDTLVHEDAVSLSAFGPVYFAADYRGVTRIELATEHYWQAVVDQMGFVIPAD